MGEGDVSQRDVFPVKFDVLQHLVEHVNPTRLDKLRALLLNRGLLTHVQHEHELPCSIRHAVVVGSLDLRGQEQKPAGVALLDQRV